MNRILNILLCLALAAATANAQTFLDRLRKIEDGKGKIVVMQSHDIDALVNGTPATQTSQAENPATSSPSKSRPIENSKPRENDNSKNRDLDNPKPQNPETSTATSSENDTELAPTVDNRKKVMRNSYKTTGYRVQAFSGGNSRVDKQKAEKAGSVMKSHFPNEPVYVHFYSPSWKCRMGNYREQEEAERVLAQVKALGYKNACIVKGTINVAY